MNNKTIVLVLVVSLSVNLTALTLIIFDTAHFAIVHYPGIFVYLTVAWFVLFCLYLIYSAGRKKPDG